MCVCHGIRWCVKTSAPFTDQTTDMGQYDLPEHRCAGDHRPNTHGLLPQHTGVQHFQNVYLCVLICVMIVCARQVSVDRRAIGRGNK
jgi:hypothetical protein